MNKEQIEAHEKFMDEVYNKIFGVEMQVDDEIVMQTYSGIFKVRKIGSIGRISSHKTSEATK